LSAHAEVTRLGGVVGRLRSANDDARRRAEAQSRKIAKRRRTAEPTARSAELAVKVAAAEKERGKVAAALEKIEAGLQAAIEQKNQSWRPSEGPGMGRKN
jgi:multidrug resistance efflux pump